LFLVAEHCIGAKALPVLAREHPRRGLRRFLYDFARAFRDRNLALLIVFGHEACFAAHKGMLRKGGFATRGLLFSPNFMVKRKPLRHKRKQHLFFGNLSLAVNDDKSELPMTLKKR
jgi:hypothetical protein